MVRGKLVWHFPYIHFRSRQNSMVWKSLSGTCSTSSSGLGKMRWCEKSLFGTCSTSIFGLDNIRWCSWQKAFKFAPSLFSLGRIRWCTCQKRSISLHPSTLSANSDGEQVLKRQIGLHPSPASSQIRWKASDSPTLPAAAYDVYFRTLLNYNHRPGFSGLLRGDLWGSLSGATSGKATSGVVCPQVWTNYPRGRFSLKCTMV